MAGLMLGLKDYSKVKDIQKQLKIPDNKITNQKNYDDAIFDILSAIDAHSKKNGISQRQIRNIKNVDMKLNKKGIISDFSFSFNMDDGSPKNDDKKNYYFLEYIVRPNRNGPHIIVNKIS